MFVSSTKSKAQAERNVENLDKKVFKTLETQTDIVERLKRTEAKLVQPLQSSDTQSLWGLLHSYKSPRENYGQY